MVINHDIKKKPGVLEDSSKTGDGRKLWRVITSLNGTPKNNSPNEAMIHNDRCITLDKRKADIFIKHYAAVGKIDMFKEDRTENWKLKISLHDIFQYLRRSAEGGLKKYAAKRGSRANTSWGWRKKNVNKVWTAHVRSVLNYAAGG